MNVTFNLTATNIEEIVSYLKSHTELTIEVMAKYVTDNIKLKLVVT